MSKTALSLLTELKTEKKDFRGGKVTVKELSYKQVTDFSKVAAESDTVDELESNKQALGMIIRAGIAEYADLTDEELEAAAPAALKDLGEMVMNYNGLGVVNDEGK